HRLHRIGGLAGSNPREPQLCRLSTSKSPTLCSPCVWSLARRTMRYWERRRRKLSEPLGGTMASQKPIEANQANALSSTGPKTTDGKVIASKNSFRHGLTTRGLLPDEDPKVFEEFADRMRADLAPVGELEGLLVERIVSSAWRLRRVPRVESW